MILISLFAYFALLALAGILLVRKNKSFDDYFFGARNLGSLLIFFTVTASWFGAASTLATFDDALNEF